MLTGAVLVCLVTGVILTVTGVGNARQAALTLKLGADQLAPRTGWPAQQAWTGLVAQVQASTNASGREALEILAAGNQILPARALDHPRPLGWRLTHTTSATARLPVLIEAAGAASVVAKRRYIAK